MVEVGLGEDQPVLTCRTFLSGLYRRAKMIFLDGEGGLFHLESEAYRIKESMVLRFVEMPICPHLNIEGTTLSMPSSLQGYEFNLHYHSVTAGFDVGFGFQKSQPFDYQRQGFLSEPQWKHTHTYIPTGSHTLDVGRKTF